MSEATRKLSREKNRNQVDREKKELEDTYFLGSQNTAKSQKRKVESFKFVPWGIVLLIFSIGFFLINVKEKINIKIIVSKEALTAERAQDIVNPVREFGLFTPLEKSFLTERAVRADSGFFSEGESASDGVSPEWNGIFDEGIVNSFRFYGGLKPDNKFTDRCLILVTAKKPDWAYMLVDFIKPIDFSKNFLIFAARGNKGGEKLKIKLTDVNMRTFEQGALPVITLTDKWQTIVVNLDRFDSNLDETEICRVTFILGSRLTGNKAGTIIYLKDIAVTKNSTFPNYVK